MNNLNDNSHHRDGTTTSKTASIPHNGKCYDGHIVLKNDGDRDVYVGDSNASEAMSTVFSRRPATTQ